VPDTITATTRHGREKTSASPFSVRSIRMTITPSLERPVHGDPPPVPALPVPAPKGSRCSFCQADVHTLDLTIPDSLAHGERASNGLFCSERCRDCVLALAALHPSPLAPYAFVQRRGLLTDELLDLWRQNKGPDPALVLQAARKASRGLTLDAES
jgi:hypothetical protein